MTEYELYNKCLQCKEETYKGKMESDEELFEILLQYSPNKDRIYSHGICQKCEQKDEQ